MEKSNLTLIYWLSNGWRTFRDNPKLMILGAMIYSSTYIISGLLAHLPFGRYFVLAIELLISIPLTAGWWFLSLQLVRGNSAKWLDMFAGFRCFLRVWITFMLTTLILLMGLVLFLVPGIIWVLKYGLALFVTMDKGLASHKAIEFSGRITDGYKNKLFLLLLIGFVLLLPMTWPFAIGLQNIGGNKGNFYMMVGIIPYLVGFLVVTPWLTAAWATAYDTLSKTYEQIDISQTC